MRYEREASISLNPDGARPAGEAAPYIGLARKYLGYLIQECETNDLFSLFKTHHLQDGTIIRVGKVAEAVYITIKTVGGREVVIPEKEAIFIAWYFSSSYLTGYKDGLDWLVSFFDHKKPEGEWEQRFEINPEWATFDWYDPTGEIVLTISMSANGRYGLNIASSSYFYNRGERRGRAPDSINGICVGENTQEDQFFIVACHDGQTDKFYARPYAETGYVDNSLYDAVTNPDGWRLLGSYDRTSWSVLTTQRGHTFFNGSGTKSLSIVPLDDTGTHRLEGTIDLDSFAVVFSHTLISERLERDVITNVTPTFYVNTAYLKGTWTICPYVTAPQICANCDYKTLTYKDETHLFSGRLLVAVDFDGDDEKTAYVTIEESESSTGNLKFYLYYISTNWYCVSSDLREYDEFSFHKIQDDGYKTHLEFGGRKIKIYESTFKQTTKATGDAQGVLTVDEDIVREERLFTSDVLLFDLRKNILIMETLLYEFLPNSSIENVMSGTYEEEVLYKAHAGLANRIFDSTGIPIAPSERTNPYNGTLEGGSVFYDSDTTEFVSTELNLSKSNSGAVSKDGHVMFSYKRLWGGSYDDIDINFLYSSDSGQLKDPFELEEDIASDITYSNNSYQQIGLW